MTRALVTGGTGFAGRFLVAHLAGDGVEVHATTHEGDSEASGATGVHALDVRDAHDVARLIRELQPDEIYHLAGVTLPASGDVAGFYAVNLGGANHVLEAARLHAPTSKVLIVGSGYAYAPRSEPIDETWPLAPENHYGASKAATEVVARAYAHDGLHVVMARPFNHSGPGQSPIFVLPTIVGQARAAKRRGQESVTLQLGNLDPIRDISDVRDIVAGYVIALRGGTAGEAYNLASGMGHSIRELVDLVGSAGGISVEVEVDSERVRPADLSILVADVTRVRSLGWEPQFDLRTTIEHMLA